MDDFGIGKRIEIARKAKGMSQEELAKKVGYKGRMSISKIETGKSELMMDKVRAFANALDVTVDYIIGWDQQKTENLTSIQLDENTSKVLSKFQALNPDDQMYVLSMIDRLLK